jgi:hypothetical protein
MPIRGVAYLLFRLRLHHSAILVLTYLRCHEWIHVCPIWAALGSVQQVGSIGLETMAKPKEDPIVRLLLPLPLYCMTLTRDSQPIYFC